MKPATTITTTLVLLAAAAPMTALGQQIPNQGLPTSGYYAYNPTEGSPNSLQFQAVRDSLNMLDVEAEGEDRGEPDGDSDTIGGTLTRWGIQNQNGERYDLHYQHAQRVFEGSRARLIIDAPINILHPDTVHALGYSFPGATAVSGTLNVGLELPAQPNWLITPRVSYGVALAGSYFGGNGELGTGSLTSRYQIRHVGRGEIIIGDMVAYTHSTKLLTSQKFYFPVINWVFRNGIAYQLPLKSRMFGRQTSLRASYVFTIATKDPLFFKKTHELGFSMGVRAREAEQKSRFEQLRVGILYTRASDQYVSTDHYHAISLTLGYRF
ncbi:hypothetical protein [Novosphingobium sp.]|uniref:hypothetical protein n=1 Tax=Novosphingobium sp. TaxID=1874826 RepID=UPI003B524C8A